VFADLKHRAGKELCRQSHGRGMLAAILTTIFDLLFGCHHAQLSRVFTLQGETYKVCCDCGAKFAYSLETMQSSAGWRSSPCTLDVESLPMNMR
jgi:hypothetical protein